MNRTILGLILFLLMPVCLYSQNINPDKQNSVSHEQLHNRLSRQSLINAAQQALRDSIASRGENICDKATSSILIEVSERSVPYRILTDSLGITLQLFYKDKCVYNDFVEYKDSNFAKIKAKANASKLVKTAKHNDSITTSQAIKVKFNNQSETYCELNNDKGVVDYSGDLKSFLTYIESLIPDFKTIISSEYRDTNEFKGDVAYINFVKISPTSLKAEKGILSLDLDNMINLYSEEHSSPLTFEIELSNENAKNLSLIKINHYYDKKKKLNLYGFTFEDVVKEGKCPSSVKTTNNNISTVIFNIDGLESGVYGIYNKSTDSIYIFELLGVESAVG